METVPVPIIDQNTQAHYYTPTDRQAIYCFKFRNIHHH